MKAVLYVLVLLAFAFSCKTSKTNTDKTSTGNTVENDTVRIANDDLEYEIIIIDPGFNTWLETMARPRGFHSQQYMEARNILFVTEWNQRVLQPQRFDPRLYELQIDYRQGIDYGYEVNYKLYNYFIYFQLKYKQQLSNFVPRI
ncbi:MAG TPA: DUF6146 family protein [Flavobacteriaceae bacterium]|nr:DUF6146 family protein [Flavobacteriaceae bacterium]